MTPISDAELDEILSRVNAATSVEWRSFIEGRDHESGDDFIMTGADDLYLAGATRADQDFIAHARQDVPRLVAEVRRLKDLIAQLEKAKRS